MAPVDTKAWFDTLTPIDPPGFEDQHPGWCRRHYAPAVRLHGNPTGASLHLARTVIRLIRGQIPAGTTVTNGQITEYLTATREPGCCLAGDDRMYRIWSNWLPAA